MAEVVLDLLSSLSGCLGCFPSSPTLKVNSRSLKILRLLGEVCPTFHLYIYIHPMNQAKQLTCACQGGFSYVYLVQDTSSSELFALKKIRCPFGAESVAQAMREVEAYKLFAHSKGIIHAVDYAIATERGGGEESKTVYVLLPYYRRGNLQDMINANLVNHTRFPEKRLMCLFLGVCKALRDMHQYRGPGLGGQAATGGQAERMEVPSRGKGKGKGKGRQSAGGEEDEEDENEQQKPLMTEDERMPAPAPGQIRSYAHRDIKPGLSPTLTHFLTQH